MGRLFTQGNLLPLLVLLLLVYGVFSYSFHFFLSGAVTHLLLLFLAILGCLEFKKVLLRKKVGKIFCALFIYNVLLYLIGFFFVNDSLYMSFNISFFISSLIFSTYCYFSINTEKTLSMLGYIIKYILPIYTMALLVNYVFLPTGLMYDRFYLSFFPMLYLFLPFCNRKAFGICLIFSFIAIIREADFRALVLLNLFGFFIYLVIIRKYLFGKNILKILAYFFLFFPIGLLILSICTGLNPFTLLDDSSLSSFSLGNETIAMSGDSRSFLFIEVYEHLCKYNALIWGTTPGIGYQTSLANVSDDFFMLLKGGRIDTEVGILEFFHFGGLINVTLLFAFFFVFIKGVFVKAKNRFAYVICVYVSFRWFFLFMEGDIIMHMQWISLLIVMGLFSSDRLLNMTDKELEVILKYNLKKGLR